LSAADGAMINFLKDPDETDSIFVVCVVLKAPYMVYSVHYDFSLFFKMLNLYCNKKGSVTN